MCAFKCVPPPPLQTLTHTHTHTHSVVMKAAMEAVLQNEPKPCLLFMRDFHSIVNSDERLTQLNRILQNWRCVA